MLQLKSTPAAPAYLYQGVWGVRRRRRGGPVPGILSGSPTRACRLLLMGCAPTSGWVSVLGGLGGVGAAGPPRWRLWRSLRLVWLVWWFP